MTVTGAYVADTPCNSFTAYTSAPTNSSVISTTVITDNVPIVTSVPISSDIMTIAAPANSVAPTATAVSGSPIVVVKQLQRYIKLENVLRSF